MLITHVWLTALTAKELLLCSRCTIRVHLKCILGAWWGVPAFSSLFSSIVTPNNWTDFLVLIVVFSVFNVLLVFLLLFHFYNTVTWNLWGFAITLPSLNHCAADSDPSLKIFRRPLVLFTSAEMTSTKFLKLCLC